MNTITKLSHLIGKMDKNNNFEDWTECVTTSSYRNESNGGNQSINNRTTNGYKAGRDRQRPVFRCYNCRNEGHMSRHCPQPRVDRTFTRRPNTCFNCRSEGHLKKDCPQERQQTKDHIKVWSLSSAENSSQSKIDFNNKSEELVVKEVVNESEMDSKINSEELIISEVVKQIVDKVSLDSLSVSSHVKENIRQMVN